MKAEPMPQILLTAFGPYGPFPDNASWLALIELTRDLPDFVSVTTRRYPVDFLEEAQLDRVGCFQYSPVEGASANELPNPVEEAVKQERERRRTQPGEGARRFRRRGWGGSPRARG